MELNLHANATTTPKTRSYIQRSKKSVAELAAELGVSETTIYRWRGRTTVADRSHRPLNLTTSLSAVEERAVCELRTSLQLPLDDIVEVMQRTQEERTPEFLAINPNGRIRDTRGGESAIGDGRTADR